MSLNTIRFYLHIFNMSNSIRVTTQADWHYLMDKKNEDWARAFIIYPAYHAYVTRKSSAV